MPLFGCDESASRRHQRCKRWEPCQWTQCFYGQHRTKLSQITRSQDLGEIPYLNRQSSICKSNTHITQHCLVMSTYSWMRETLFGWIKVAIGYISCWIYVSILNEIALVILNRGQMITTSELQLRIRGFSTRSIFSSSLKSLKHKKINGQEKQLETSVFFLSLQWGVRQLKWPQISFLIKSTSIPIEPDGP